MRGRGKERGRGAPLFICVMSKPPLMKSEAEAIEIEIDNNNKKAKRNRNRIQNQERERGRETGRRGMLPADGVFEISLSFQYQFSLFGQAGLLRPTAKGFGIGIGIGLGFGRRCRHSVGARSPHTMCYLDINRRQLNA